MQKLSVFNLVTLDGYISGDLLEQVRKLKKQSGTGLTILGSGIVAQLAQAGLIDEYQLLLNPVILGKGRTMFEGVEGKPALKLISTRTFGNGNVLLCYEPIKERKRKQ